ncbi:unnamed protein product, partial [Iphiclides podalirius]
MVNYCCVYGCGRNSRLNKHLNYYSLPKERHRQVEWLKAACREDLLKRIEEKAAVSSRICSRHFPPSSIKNRHLSNDAVPTLCLPGSWNEEEIEPTPAVHNDIICDNCGNPIMGFRYKCVNCEDFDLCQKCEMQEAHPDHYMLRIPKPLKFKLADNLITKWRKLFKSAHILPNSEEESKVQENMSSDDEPITKYAKDYDSGVDLSEDIKLKIRKEVTRVLKDKLDGEQTKFVKEDPTKAKRKMSFKGNRPNKRNKTVRTSIEIDKTSTVATVSLDNNVPDLVFADVNEIKDEQEGARKNELAASIASVASDATDMKLEDDLSQLMIEMTKSGKQMLYKYCDGNLK